MRKTFNHIIADAIKSMPGAKASRVADYIATEEREAFEEWALGKLIVAVKGQFNRIKKAELRANPAQAWLDLPDLKDFQHIPVAVRKDSLEEYRERIVAKERELKGYKIARLSLKKEKIAKRELREMKRLEPLIAPYFANDPTMTVERAAGLYQETVQRIGPSQRRKAQAREAAKRAKRART